MFIRFDRMYERDIRTDGQTDKQTPHDGIGRTCIASRGKNPEEMEKKFCTWIAIRHIVTVKNLVTSS